MYPLESLWVHQALVFEQRKRQYFDVELRVCDMKKVSVQIGIQARWLESRGVQRGFY